MLRRRIPYLIKHDAMKAYVGVEVQLHAFLTLALHAGKWSVDALDVLPPG